MALEIPSSHVQEVVNELSKLPGIGHRTAMRLALYILNNDNLYALHLSDAIKNMIANVKHCKICNNISDTEICGICSSTKRNKSMVCVVANVRDFLAIEETGQYSGMYHVLGGVISPINGIGVSDIDISGFLTRISGDAGIKEIIFALPTTIEGETTALYLYKHLQNKDLTISTIARGVAFGDELEYTDQVTLGRSITNRITYKTM